LIPESLQFQKVMVCQGQAMGVDSVLAPIVIQEGPYLTSGQSFLNEVMPDTAMQKLILV
jgi:hypothetical protein